ncbi:toxin-antitoxin system, toxin component domain protein, partial [Enterococcus faecalis]|nr:toxin-antitoxin system, toxin component domain protein [Enterococcus faecalis]
MYNKKMLEYRDVDSEDYNNYSENALFLLKVISDWASIPVSEITYHEVIDYFVNNFMIEIVFFDDNDRIINP